MSKRHRRALITFTILIITLIASLAAPNARADTNDQLIDANWSAICTMLDNEPSLHGTGTTISRVSQTLNVSANTAAYYVSSSIYQHCPKHSQLLRDFAVYLQLAATGNGKQ